MLWSIVGELIGTTGHVALYKVSLKLMTLQPGSAPFYLTSLPRTEII
jgi:hypothetical protein